MNDFHIMTMNECIQFAQKVYEKIFITNECDISKDGDENLIFDAISNSGKRRVTPKLKFLSLSRRIPSGVQSNSFSQFESRDSSGRRDRWSVSMHRLWRLRSDREEPKSKSKRSPRGKKKLKELPLERQKKPFLSLIRRGMHLRYFYN